MRGVEQDNSLHVRLRFQTMLVSSDGDNLELPYYWRSLYLSPAFAKKYFGETDRKWIWYLRSSVMFEYIHEWAYFLRDKGLIKPVDQKAGDSTGGEAGE